MHSLDKCVTEIHFSTSIFLAENSVHAQPVHMRPIKLEDLVPQTAEFSLRSTGQTYRLRPLNIDDRIWINQTYGKNLQQIFRHVLVKEISHIAFHQMLEEDKVNFTVKNVEIVDDDGNKREIKLGGLNLFRTLVEGTDEITAILTAVLHAIGISQPLLEEMAAEVSGEESQKKNETLTGEKSLTSSQVNTDGLSEKSDS